MGRKNIRDTSTIVSNKMVYDEWYNTLKEIVLSRFIYEGLPETIDQRFIELGLCEKGMMVYFNDEMIGDLCLNAMIGAPLNVYNVPINRTAYASNGYQKKLTTENSVLIYNNYLRNPSEFKIRIYATKLANIDRTIDININALKTPVIMKADQKTLLSVKNLYAQYDGNEPFIFLDKSLDENSFKVFNLNSPAHFKDLQIQKQKIFNEFLTFMGFENSNTEKKERMVADEIGGNYGAVEGYRNTFLKARKEGVEKINIKFNQNITVRFNSDLETMLNRGNINIEEEGIEYE